MNSASSQYSVPVSWPEAADSYREAAEYGLNILQDEVEDLLSVKASITIAEDFGALVTLLTRVALMLGADTCASAMGQVGDLFARARDEFAKGITRHNCVSAIGILDYVNLVQCCGTEVDFTDAEVEAWLERLLTHRKTLTETECETLALASMALNRPDWALAYLDDTLEPHFEPGRAFGPNTHGLKLYLLAAQQQGAAADAVAPAWQDCLLGFPRKLAAETMGWSDLVWLGRVFYQGFTGLELGQVAARVHQDVQALSHE